MTSTTGPRVLLWLLIGSSILIGIYAFLFQLGWSGNSEFEERFAQLPLLAAFHVLGSGVALLIGGFQFLPGLRARRTNLHRWLGRIYLSAVLLGGIGGFALARQADGGLAGQFGFSLLAVFWLLSGWQAYAAIRRRDIPAHRVWMIRNFSLTFAAVTLRIYLGLAQGPAGLDFDAFYPAVAWLCWVPNLIVAEWLIIASPRMAWRSTRPVESKQSSAPG